MNGRFRDYARAAGEARLARTSPGRASLVLATASTSVLWLDARDRRDRRRAARRCAAWRVAALGPDVLAGDFDSRLAASRARVAPSRAPIGEVLLDQRVAAGIGNIWKTESCFARGSIRARACATRRITCSSDLRDRARADAELRRGLARFPRVLRGPASRVRGADRRSRRTSSATRRAGRGLPHCQRVLRTVVSGSRR